MNIDEVIGALDRLALGGDFPFPHWLGGDVVDQGPSYCRACADKKVVAGEAEHIDGGWQQEEDGCCHCEECGRTLDYTLSDCGVNGELEHYLSNPPKSPLCAQEAYHLSRVLENYHHLPAVLALLPATEIAIKGTGRIGIATQGSDGAWDAMYEIRKRITRMMDNWGEYIFRESEAPIQCAVWARMNRGSIHMFRAKAMFTLEHKVKAPETKRIAPFLAKIGSTREPLKLFTEGLPLQLDD